MSKEYTFSYRGGEMRITIDAASKEDARRQLDEAIKGSVCVDEGNGYTLDIALWYTHPSFWVLVE